MNGERTEEQADLRRWVYLLWEPTKRDIPKKLLAMVLPSGKLHSNRCWESSPRPQSNAWYATPVIICYTAGKGLNWTRSHYELKDEAIELKHGDWNRARKQVRLAPKTNIEAVFAAARDLQMTESLKATVNRAPSIHMMKSSVRKNKRKRAVQLAGAIVECKAVAKYTKEELQSRHHKLKQPDLIAECRAHGLRTSGLTKKDNGDVAHHSSSQQ